jgi:phosphohistidine swiveling domain-containing protein
MNNEYEHLASSKRSVLSTFLLVNPVALMDYFKITKIPTFNYYNGEVYQKREQFAQIKELILQSPEKEVAKIIKLISGQCRILENETNYLDRSWRDYSEEELYLPFQKFIKSTEVFFAFLFIPTVLEEIVVEKIKKFTEKSSINLNDLFISDRPDEAVVAEQILLELSIKKSQKRDIMPELEKFLDRYAWLPTQFFLGQPYDLPACHQLVSDRLAHDPERALKIIKEGQKNVEDGYLKLINSLRPNKEFLKWLKIARRLTAVRNSRLNSLNKSFFRAYSLFFEVASRYRISIEEVVSATPSEISMWFTGSDRPDKKTLSERAAGFGLVTNLGVIKLLSAKECQTELKKIQSVNILGFAGEIKGLVAHSGKARGYVHLIFTRHDLKKFETGEILVTPAMNAPEFIEAIGRAAAIVTDLGGVTSHAAVVAHDFLKPCLVGTKVASKILKNGELVEVDAIKGEITRIG